MATFLAHQGGWDEVVRVVAPIVIVVLALTFLNRRMAAGDTQTVRPDVENETTGANKRSS